MYPPHAAIIMGLQEAYGRLRIPNVREALKAVRRLYTLANADGRIEDVEAH